MTLITFDCDRCKQSVTGHFTGSGTSGFYRVDSPNEETGARGGGWAQFGREGETLVCDSCVQSMPEYEAVYGARPEKRS